MDLCDVNGRGADPCRLSHYGSVHTPGRENQPIRSRHAASIPRHRMPGGNMFGLLKSVKGLGGKK